MRSSRKDEQKPRAMTFNSAPAQSRYIGELREEKKTLRCCAMNDKDLTPIFDRLEQTYVSTDITVILKCFAPSFSTVVLRIFTVL